MAFEKIGEVEVGDTEYTLLSTTLANRVIKGVNAANAPTVLPTGICTIESSDDSVVFTFKTFKVVACDPEGNQKTYRFVGMEVANDPPPEEE